MRLVRTWLALGGCVALLLAGVAGAGSRTASPQTQPSTLVFLVNPSKRVHDSVFRHAKEIVSAVARPQLTLTGFYEQVTTDDGFPFDRAFISTSSPSLGAEPTITPRPDCSHGTGYQKAKCQKDYERTHEEQLDARREWKERAGRDVAAWKARTLATLGRVARARKTEESPNGVWNLRKGLTDAGQIVQALNAPVRCVVLLGGLAVRQPPPSLPTGVLADTTLVVAGWRGTPRIQEAWREVLEPVGASIVFLPEAITDLQLVESVRGCLDSSGLR